MSGKLAKALYMYCGKSAPLQALYMPLAEPSGKNRRVDVIQRLVQQSADAFRCFFAEGKIGGTLCMRSHIRYTVPLPNTFLTRLFSKQD
jgi:hypothetical protein